MVFGVQRQDGRDGRGFHSGYRFRARERLREEGALIHGLLVAGVGRQLDLHREDMIGAETEISLLEPPETLQHQPGANQ